MWPAAFVLQIQLAPKLADVHISALLVTPYTMLSVVLNRYLLFSLWVPHFVFLI